MSRYQVVNKNLIRRRKIVRFFLAGIALVVFCFFCIQPVLSLSGWTTGKFGKAYNFYGVAYTNIGNTGTSVKTVSFWIRVVSAAGKVAELNSGAYISVSGGTVSTTGFDSSTIYIDGVAASAISDSFWHLVAVTTNTAVSASAMKFGSIDTNSLNGEMDDFKIYSRVLSTREISEQYRQKSPSMAQGGTVTGSLYIMGSVNQIGIGTITPKNAFDVEGGAVIGASYSGSYYAPTNGLLVEGNIGLGTSSSSYKLDIATSTANDRGINIAHIAATGTNYGVYSSVTGAATTNYGGYYVATGATTNYGISVAALTGATSYGLDIGALSGATANYGINIGAISSTGTAAALTTGAISSTGATAYQLNLGAISGANATSHTGIALGNISGTTPLAYGINLGTLTGGTTSNYQINTGALTAVASATNAQLNLGTVSGTAASSTNYGINIGAMTSTGDTNTGLYVGAVSGATSNYAAIFAGGNVGIGTTGPDRRLDVLDASNPQLRLSQADGTTYTDFQTSSGFFNIDTTTNGITLSDGLSIGSSYAAISPPTNGLIVQGDTGVGTAYPNRKLDVLDASNPQLRLTNATSVYTEFSVAASTGDLTISLNPSTTGNDLILNMPGGTTGVNLSVCQGTACPTTTGWTLSDGGNLILENAVYWPATVSSGTAPFKLAPTGSNKELGVYDSTGTTIMIFDEGTP